MNNQIAMIVLFAHVLVFDNVDNVVFNNVVVLSFSKQIYEWALPAM